MAALRAEDFFHTGVVVADVDRAKDEFARSLGLTWGLQGDMEVPMVLADGPRIERMRFAYSAQGPPYLELVAAVEGTIFTVPGGGAHHVGYWCADTKAAAADLEVQGLVRVATIGARSLDEPAPWILHRSPSGLYVELVDEALRPGFEAGDAPATG